MKYLIAFAKFWYDFIIGDDWKIAVSVVLALGLTYLLRLSRLIHGHSVPVIGGVLVMAAFSLSLYMDTRKRKRD